MPAKPTARSELLAHLQRLIAARRTNAYQVAKVTGISRPSIDKLLSAETSPTLANVELILRGLGYTISINRTLAPTIEPGTGRGHGVPKGKRRGKG